MQVATMQTLKGLEQHSFSSLAERLDYLVSRQTLSNWVDNGTLRPAQITRQPKNTHLLFSTAKLNALHKLLKKAQIVHAAKIQGSSRCTLAQRLATGRRNAKACHEINKWRRHLGRKELSEPNPAMNPEDAIGRMSLTYDPTRDKNLIRIFGGFGKWKT